jgi:hypothetical protein
LAAQAAAQMVAGGRQQASGVEQVAVAMQSINQATVQSLSSTRQAESAARDLNELAQKPGWDCGAVPAVGCRHFGLGLIRVGSKSDLLSPLPHKHYMYLVTKLGR